MVSFRIVTDSTIDMPADIAQNIEIVPAHVYVGIAEFLDKVNFTIDNVREISEKGLKIRTSAPSVKDWMRACEKIGKELPILIMTLGTAFSGAYNSAKVAAKMLERKGYRVHVFDTHNSSIASGMMVEHAYKKSLAGQAVAEVIDDLKKLRDRVRLYLVVADLESTARSGRMPKILGKLGSALKIHPIFKVENGVPKIWKILRGMGKVVDTLEAIAPTSRRIFLGKAGESKWADDLEERLRAKNSKVVTIPADPAIAAHFGIGSFGISFIED